MTDEEKTQETKKEEKPLSLVEEAAKVRDEIRAENDRREKILQEEQKLQADRMLGGTTGGRVEPEPVKEETPQEYAQRMLKGQRYEGEPPL